MRRSGRGVGFWVFLGALVCALVVTGFVLFMNVNGGENLGVSTSLAPAVFAFFVFPILSGAFTAFLARKLEAPLSPWLWAVLGAFFPVVAPVIVLVVGASARHKTARISQAPEYAAAQSGAEARRLAAGLH